MTGSAGAAANAAADAGAVVHEVLRYGVILLWGCLPCLVPEPAEMSQVGPRQ